MDTEQQVRLNFLDEAEDYLDRIESVLLNLSQTGADPQAMDLALRAAHSLKGGGRNDGLRADEPDCSPSRRFLQNLASAA